MTSSNESNKWAVVTGASDGIGRALVHELGEKGFNILAIGRSQRKMAELVAEFKGPRFLEVHTMEFNRPGSAEALKAVIAGKKIEVFSPTAGFGSSGNFVDLDLAKEMEMIDVNCRAVVEQTQLFARIFKQQGRGTLIMFSSVLGFAGAGTTSTYAATKNFIQSFSEGLRAELKPSGVNVLTVCPALTNTGFAQASKMSFSTADSAGSVAKGIVKNLGTSRTLYPTPRAKFLVSSLAIVSRETRVALLSKIMGGMQSVH
jgi:short-subunit dehydrogenase